jgi:hypothetical protein
MTGSTCYYLVFSLLSSFQSLQAPGLSAELKTGGYDLLGTNKNPLDEWARASP